MGGKDGVPKILVMLYTVGTVSKNQSCSQSKLNWGLLPLLPLLSCGY